ncbi:MAG: MFS transporter [Victivallales bacterium]|nr:MFS transporter [Victivallales bacterium]
MFNFYKTVDLTPERERAAERDSILSACTGAMGDVTLTDSAIIILYAAMLGASDMFSMVTTALMPLFNGICIIPMAWIAARFGNQWLIMRIGVLSLLAYFLIAAAPFFGAAAVPMLIFMLILFAFFHTGYVAGWFPMLDSFLSQERRHAYLGKMRFWWQFSSTVFIFGVGMCIGKNPPLWHLQLVLLIAAVIFSGRLFFIGRIPVFKTEKQETYSFRKGLAMALANKPLAGYSVYLFVLNLAAYGTIPLMTLYLKRYLHAPDNIIVIISAVTLGGMLLGSLCAGKIIEKFGIKRAFLGIHLAYALVNISLFFIGKDTFHPNLTYALITFLLLVYSFTFANANIASTGEMMALATPGNKVMAMAFCGTFYYGGSGLSRLVTSLVLGCGLLAPEWHIGNVKFCHYQTIFLIYSVAIVFAAMLLVVVPAIFPKGEYFYREH